MIQCQQSKIPYARSVARISIRRTPTRVAFCTGTLINNEANNGHAFFLTAFHCVDANKNKVLEQTEIDALLLSDFQFQFWRVNCNGSVNNQFLEFSGAILRASSSLTDFVLLDLLNILKAKICVLQV
jgi:hypothetical protein